MSKGASGLQWAEEAVEAERRISSAILETAALFVVVLDPDYRVIRFNRACEQATGYSFPEVEGRYGPGLMAVGEDVDRFRATLEQVRTEGTAREFEGYSRTRDGASLLIGWTITVSADGNGGLPFIIATGIDRSDNKRLENTVLEISGRERRRIGQDLHDGLGQHLTGIAFLAKVQEQRLAEKALPEAADAAKIVKLVNEAIHKTRELARGLLPVLAGPNGLTPALQQWAGEMEDIFQICCRFECEDPIWMSDDGAADHLYRIAQEAVHNAIKHGRAKNVLIGLRAAEDGGVLTIRDDGCGITQAAASHTGMGLRIMNYRTHMIGGSLHVERSATRGTLVTCRFPMDRRNAI